MTLQIQPQLNLFSILAYSQLLKSSKKEKPLNVQHSKALYLKDYSTQRA